MRVLHVITGLGVGGAEHQLRLVLPRLAAEPAVVTLTNPGPVATAIRTTGIPVHDLGMRGNRDLTAVPRLAAFIRAGRFDVVHTHLYRACVYGRIAARMAGVRAVVATEHSLNDGIIEARPTTAGVRALYLAAERLGRVTVAVSEAVRQRLVAWAVPDRRITVIPNGIDPAELRPDPVLRLQTRARLGIPARARVVGGLGRLEPTKRFDLLVRAVAALPDTTLLLAGEGPARAGLAALAGELGIADRVAFAGGLPHARAALCAMDVFASPSPQETFGMAVVEALAAGLPVVYVSCPPLEARPDPAARRVPATPEALRDAVRAALSRPGTAAPETVAQHDIGRVAGALDQLYGRLTRPDRVWSRTT
ncbi:glycosyltransferase [Dactylosporangium siamense]|uniref:Glycosyl transferase n=1 Tax=Dactylosporangium siamense TaxID=685454 RepID=A0A919PGL2_9ACTN|nr:glycosyltransferase [Dactylosporangium siamense]GIG43807.1 glycosyl transferase [Dactylosporangium siamense]